MQPPKCVFPSSILLKPVCSSNVPGTKPFHDDNPKALKQTLVNQNPSKPHEEGSFQVTEICEIKICNDI